MTLSAWTSSRPRFRLLESLTSSTVVMKAISSSTIQILWNGVPSKKFKSVRGIRQGYPLSPYLFVLCIEWLGRLMHAQIDEGRWRPIRLSRPGPNLLHLFFADDLVIFYKAKMHQANLFQVC